MWDVFTMERDARDFQSGVATLCSMAIVCFIFMWDPFTVLITTAVIASIMTGNKFGDFGSILKQETAPTLSLSQQHHELKLKGQPYHCSHLQEYEVGSVSHYLRIWCKFVSSPGNVIWLEQASCAMAENKWLISFLPNEVTIELLLHNSSLVKW